MKETKTRRCAVCNDVKNWTLFGDGITCPKTTCLACKLKGVGFTETKVLMNVKRIIREKIK